MYDERDERRIIHKVHLHPKITYKDFKTETGLTLSGHTLRAMLKKHGIIHWRCKKRPRLTATIAALRLAFARQYVGFDWSTTLFSDECSIEEGVGRKREWAFGYPDERWTKERLTTCTKSKGATVMVWACVGKSIERSELIVMERSAESPRGGYSSRSYTDTLEEGLVPLYDGQLYQQDNAPVYMSHYTINWPANMGIKVLVNWPPYSPDINPVEHLWPRLKQMFYELRPELDNITAVEEQRQILMDVLPEAWKAIRSIFHVTG